MKLSKLAPREGYDRKLPKNVKKRNHADLCVLLQLLDGVGISFVVLKKNGDLIG